MGDCTRKLVYFLPCYKKLEYKFMFDDTKQRLVALPSMLCCLCIQYIVSDINIWLMTVQSNSFYSSLEPHIFWWNCMWQHPAATTDLAVSALCSHRSCLSRGGPGRGRSVPWPVWGRSQGRCGSPGTPTPTVSAWGYTMPGWCSIQRLMASWPVCVNEGRAGSTN